MGMQWGNMFTNIRGIVMYSLSPYEQRTFAGAFSKGVPNIFRRFRSQVYRVAPPFVVAYMVYVWANKEHDRLSRKNPADYVDDE